MCVSKKLKIIGNIVREIERNGNLIQIDVYMIIITIHMQCRINYKYIYSHVSDVYAQVYIYK